MPPSPAALALTAVLGSVTPPGRLRRAVDEALQRVDGADTELIDLAERRVAFADGALQGTPVALVAMGGSDHHYLGAERHLRDILAFFGAHPLPTAVYLTSRDFSDGAPSPRAEQQLDAVLAAAVTLAAALRGRPPLGPPPLAGGL